MSECAKIDADITIDCDNPLQAGTKDRLILINFDDWQDATVTRNNSNNQIYQAIDLPSGTRAYLVEGINDSTLPKHSYVQGAFLGSFMHEVNYKVFSLGADIKELLEKKTKGRFVAIVENKFKGNNGECAFEVYGADSGLIVTLLERDPGNADTQGAYDLTLASSEKSREAHLPATIFSTNYATTKAIVDALLV